MKIVRSAFRRMTTLALVLACAAAPALATTFTVRNGGDSLPSGLHPCTSAPANCTLRDALSEGNQTVGPHTIDFDASVTQVTLSNGGSLQLANQYTITGNPASRTIIDGNHQACFWIDDTQNAINGNKGANGSIIQNLIIINCSGAGIVATGYDLHIVNNYIGTDNNPASTVGNGQEGISFSSASNAYTLTPQMLANAYNQLPPAPMDPATADAYATAFADLLANAITTISPPNYVTNNVISGNSGDGIMISSQHLAGVIIAGNRIGTTSSGDQAIPNNGNGISLLGSSFGNFIGPDGVEAGNIISGNKGYGIYVAPTTVSLPNFIMGNRIGLPGSPGNTVGNGKSGIYVSDSRPDVSAGRPNPTTMSLWIGPRNLIGNNLGTSGSSDLDTLAGTEAGIIITGQTTSGVYVTGNSIGIAEFSGAPDQTNNYGNAGDGIAVTADHNTIGGTWPADANVIAANGRHGIVINGGTDNKILNNYIGKHPAFPADMTLGNAGDGIHVYDGNTTAIGGSNPADPNLIAANGRNGVRIRNGSETGGWGNLLQRNVIFGNGQLVPGVGIDLDYENNQTSPPHAESRTNSANLDQAQPVLCQGGGSGSCSGSQAPVSSGGSTTIDWTLASHGPAVFRIEFFSIDNSDDNAALSMKFLDETVVTTDGSANLSTAAGNTSCSGTGPGRCRTILGGDAGGRYVIATATDVTPLTNSAPGGLGWNANLACLADYQGVSPANCYVNSTSEMSNAVSVSASAPTATTAAATLIGTTTATLNGTVSANGALTTVNFEYGLSFPSYGGIAVPPSPAAAAQSPLAATASAAAVSLNLTGLICATTYHFRVEADNGIGGTVNGFDDSFTTGACSVSTPTSTTGTATAITSSSATLNGLVSAAGAAATVTFEWGLTTAYGLPATPTPIQVTAGANNQPVSTGATGLQCGQTYHFRMNVDNGGGPVHGSDASFNTAACGAAAPVVITGTASPIAATTATVQGTINPNGASTTATFRYGTTMALASSAAGGTVPVGPSGPATANLSGLNCNTTYYYRLDGDNGVGGTASGSTLSFTTAACPAGAPSATTDVATGVTATAATLNGTVSANGTPTNVSFEYGTSTAFGSNAAATPASVTTNGATVSASLNALNCGTTYYYRVVADNGIGGAINGGPATFATGTCPLDQTVSFTSSAPVNATVGGATYTPTATATSGLVVAITVDATSSGVCQMSGSAVSFVGTGTCTLNANQAGDSSYNPAPQVQQSFIVSSAAKTNQTVSFTSSAPVNATVGGATYTPTATATSGLVVAITVDSTSSGVCQMSGSVVSFVGTGTCTLNANQAGNGSYNPAPQVQQSFIVSSAAKTNQTVSFTSSAPVNATVNGATYTPTATATSGLVVAITVDSTSSGVCQMSGSAVSFVGTGTCTLNANQAGNGSYNPAPQVQQSFIVATSKSFTGGTATNSGMATATISGGGVNCGFAAAAFVLPPVAPPAGTNFPHGLFSFTLSSCDSSPVTIQVTYPSPLGTAVYQKYGPTPPSNPATWYVMPGASVVGNVATFSITDGQIGDDDLTVNGTIVDAGGPSVPAAVGPVGASIPTLSEWGLGLLAMLLAMMAWPAGQPAARRRR